MVSTLPSSFKRLWFDPLKGSHYYRSANSFVSSDKSLACTLTKGSPKNGLCSGGEEHKVWCKHKTTLFLNWLYLFCIGMVFLNLWISQQIFFFLTFKTHLSKFIQCFVKERNHVSPLNKKIWESCFLIQKITKRKGYYVIYKQFFRSNKCYRNSTPKHLCFRATIENHTGNNNFLFFSQKQGNYWLKRKQVENC